MTELCPVFYFGNDLETDREVLLKDLTDETFRHFFHVLALVGPEQKTEIIPTPLLRQRYYREQNISVFGITLSKRTAEDLLSSVYGEVFRKTGDIALSGFIRAKSEE